MYLFTPKSALDSSAISATSLIAYRLSPQIFDSELIASDESLLTSYHQDSQKIVPETLSTLSPLKLKTSDHKLRGLGRISPSSFVGHEFGTNKSIQNELFGSLIHKLFSMTKWKEDCLEEAVLIQSLLEHGAQRDQAKQTVSAFLNYLNLDIIASVMHRPTKSELEKTQVYTEKSFIYREGNALIQGRIDRLVVASGSGQIIDFKVGKTPAADSKHLKNYLKQLACYNKAASTLFPTVKFEAALLFLGDGGRYLLEQS